MRTKHRLGFLVAVLAVMALALGFTTTKDTEASGSILGISGCNGTIVVSGSASCDLGQMTRDIVPPGAPGAGLSSNAPLRVLDGVAPTSARSTGSCGLAPSGGTACLLVHDGRSTVNNTNVDFIGTERLDKLLDSTNTDGSMTSTPSSRQLIQPPDNLSHSLVTAPGSDGDARLDNRFRDSADTIGSQRLDKLLTNGDATMTSNSPLAGMQLTQPNAFNESTVSVTGPPAAITAAAAPDTSASSRGTTQAILDPPQSSAPLAAPRTGQGSADAFAIRPHDVGDASPKEVTSSGSSTSIVTNVPDSGEAGLAPNSVWPLALPIASLLVIIVASAAVVSVARR